MSDIWYDNNKYKKGRIKTINVGRQLYGFLLAFLSFLHLQTQFINVIKLFLTLYIQKYNINLYVLFFRTSSQSID